MPWLRPAAAVLLAAGAAVSGCAGGPGIATTSAESASPDPNYRIGPGDRLNVVVYDNHDLSSEVPVRPDGRISLPLIPDIVAVGKTPSQLADEVQKRLTEYVKDPHVSVIVESFVGALDQQIRVIGEATDPKAIPYRNGMTMLDVMIETHGLTRYAAGNRAVIVRRDSGKQQILHVHLADLIKDGDVSQNVQMRPGDTLIIPQSWF
jgi:polysaccharide export outer membrane protein